jgi:DNA-binding NarL/FixJ family response regulator
MARAYCLAEIARNDIPLLAAAIRAAIEGSKVSLTTLDVPMLHALAPALLVLDIDPPKPPGLEALRQLRFVIPDCIIAVFSNSESGDFVRDSHNAGANCLLSKSSGVSEVTYGLQRAWQTGCFTDPRFPASTYARSERAPLAPEP